MTLSLSENQLIKELKGIYPDAELSAIWRILAGESNLPEDLMARLKAREPIQYVLGYTWFYKRKFSVSPATLIPRPETEELCERVLTELGKTELKFADIGTGSGCIAITLCVESAGMTGVASDISDEAIRVAVHNATQNGVSTRIEFRRNNFLENYQELGKDFNLIVSNPPYISQAEKASLDDNVLLWEPHTALFPAGDDPLIFYRRLGDLLQYQEKNCVLFAEINSALASETLRLFSAFREREIITDLSGNPRFIRIKKEG